MAIGFAAIAFALNLYERHRKLDRLQARVDAPTEQPETGRKSFDQEMIARDHGARSMRRLLLRHRQARPACVHRLAALGAGVAGLMADLLPTGEHRFVAGLATIAPQFAFGRRLARAEAASNAARTPSSALDAASLVAHKLESGTCRHGAISTIRRAAAPLALDRPSHVRSPAGLQAAAGRPSSTGPTATRSR